MLESKTTIFQGQTIKTQWISIDFCLSGVLARGFSRECVLQDIASDDSKRTYVLDVTEHAGVRSVSSLPPEEVR